MSIWLHGYVLHLTLPETDQTSQISIIQYKLIRLHTVIQLNNQSTLRN